MIGIQFEPLDTCFFRDGTPFTIGSAPQEGVESLFPPHPATVVGSLRAALALDRGWDGRGRWPGEFEEVLGNGPDNLGRLAFDGPLLLLEEEPLFRTPRHLLGAKGPEGWCPRTLLRPGQPVTCDLGEAVRLPELPCGNVEAADTKLGAGDDQWLTRRGMMTVLRGEIPEKVDVRNSESLWTTEARIGLERDRTRRSAKEGMLYSTRHVRPGRRVSIGMRISGLPTDWRVPFGRPIPLGGESRLANCREWNGDPGLDSPHGEIRASGKVALVALTPLDLDESVTRGEEPVAELGGARVVSACLNRPQRIGGWDSLSCRPLPLRSVLPPGSVLFCEFPEGGGEAFAAGEGMVRLGARTEWGFGLVASGVWPANEGHGS